MREPRKLFAGLFFILICFTAVACKPQTDDKQLTFTNLAHLDHLYEDIQIDGRDMAIIHVYAEYPDYKWVDANNEGIACVDDAARAAIVYLRHFEITGNRESLKKAKKLIDFCRYMQLDNGQFYNFIFEDLSINKTGKTSFNSFGWWAARAVWVLGEGYRVFQQQDQTYAEVLAQHLRASLPQIQALLNNYQNVTTEAGFAMPQWLVNGAASDATSELMLGLAAYVQTSQDSMAGNFLRKLADGIALKQIQDKQSSFYGAHLAWRNIWHGWGNSQTQALAMTSEALAEKPILQTAITEAKYFYPKWLQRGFPREITFTKTDTAEVTQFDQIAYAFRPPIVGCLLLHRLTGEPFYAELAGEMATWFFGNNAAGTQMYDMQTGRCFDGILSETEINRNSGAESTIEALYAIIEVENNPIAQKTLLTYLNSK